MWKPTQIDFSKEINYNLLLRLSGEEINIPYFDEVKEYNLICKEEFHITIFGTKEGFELKDFFEKNAQIADEVFHKLNTLVRETFWGGYFINKFFLLERIFNLKYGTETRRSIIQEIKIDADILNGFYKKAFDITGILFQSDFSHITLYTYSTRNKNMSLGIGISNLQELAKYNLREVFRVNKSGL